MLSHQHPLFQLSNKINWESFENAFSPLYCSTNGRPAHPIRLMCGLLILKHLRNVSDEMVVSQWSENAYVYKNIYLHILIPHGCIIIKRVNQRQRSF